MDTVLVTPYQVLSKRICFKYWPVCCAMILLGLLLLISAYRETVITCQRQWDRCSVTRLGWFAGANRTFSPEAITGIQPDYCCNSDDATFQLSLITRQGNIALNQTWLSSDNSLQPAGDLLTRFINDVSIPQLEVHILDLRLNNLILGIFFLIMGLFYLFAMSEVQLLVQDTLTGRRSSLNKVQFDRAVKAALKTHSSIDQEADVKKQDRWLKNWQVWLTWIVLPAIMFPLGIRLVSFTLRFGFYYYPILMIISVVVFGVLAIGAQAWLVQRAIGEGRRWLVFTVIGCILGFLALLLISAHFISSLQSEGIDSSGLAAGLILGISQWLVLRRRLSYASWWIIASALGIGMLASATPAAINLMIIAGLYQSLPTSLTGFLQSLSGWLGFVAYLSITGAMFVFLIHAEDKQSAVGM